MGDRKYFYFNYSRIPNVSFWGKLFSSYSDFPVCFYYENENFYEFFTGKKMIFHATTYRDRFDLCYNIYMMSIEPPLAKISIGSSSSLHGDSNEAILQYVLNQATSATEFAEKVRPLMKRKEQIVASIEAYLAKSSADEQRKQEQEKLQQAKKAEEKANAESWLDSVIKNNK